MTDLTYRILTDTTASDAGRVLSNIRQDRERALKRRVCDEMNAAAGRPPVQWERG
jgi:hypothetical protein